MTLRGFFLNIPPAWLMAIVLFASGFTAVAAADGTAGSRQKVSYYRDVRPILQANCQGCHQPAKAKGGYAMTDFKQLLAGGESEGTAIVPREPAKSAILRMITPVDGEAQMPKGKPALHEFEIGLIKSWIQQGAEDDTPADAKRLYDTEHPPVYTRAPVIASLDYSPDGTLLAVGGFHEVLLHEKRGTLAARLVGISERIQSLRFSPDGKWLAVAGGNPARLGEVQVWDVARRKLVHSVPITYDTLYGLSWSPDSKLIAFGCADNTVRAIDAISGKQVLQMGSHSDWVLSTTFSVKGDHLISGGRDMSVKLTEVAEQRFIDNVTSITPGALKGGVMCLATHPRLEHIVAGGSDGLPKVYRIFREIKREIGDDAQFIAGLFPMTGRVFTVRFSLDGTRIACGSGLDRNGELLICSYDYTNDTPKALRNIMGKVPGTRTPDEKKRLEEYKNEGIREIARIVVTNSEIYTLAFHPDGNEIATAGSDGIVRLFNTTNGGPVGEFPAVPLTKGAIVARPAWTSPSGKLPESKPEKESLPASAKIVALEVQPQTIQFQTPNDYVQLLVTARLDSGESADVTRMATFSLKPALAEISARGMVRPLKNGKAKVAISIAGKTVEAPIEINGQGSNYSADFIRDVNPVLAELGCSAGTCHGAKDGKNGFKLSLRGYDPLTDVRALTDDLASRRVNLASPDDSLMLLKAIAEVPHEGGRRTAADSKYYQILRQWIADGAQLNSKSSRAEKIEIFPQNPVLAAIGSRQQMRVVASYSDGTTRDVTAEAFLESGNGDVAAMDDAGIVTTLRRGEAPVLARYEGNYAATTVTVMGDRSGFVWKEPETWGKIDELVAEKWKRMKIAPSELCTDLEFIRRVYLDLTGLPPSPEEIAAFVEDSAAVRVKRDALIDRLVGSPEYVDFWANKWADMLQCNSKFLGTEGVELFRNWIRNEVETNTPYNEFAKKILTATGSNRENPAASYWKILRAPTDTMENTTHLFLGTRFNCNKCHDHPFERWTQDQYYNLSAFFAQVSFKEDPESAGKKVAGSRVEGAKPLYEMVTDSKTGEVKHDRTGNVTPPSFPYPAKYQTCETPTRREELAAWITTPDNRFFASSYANRIWGYLTGVGLIEPLDDIRAGNPPRNPALLEHLTGEFVDSGFDVRHLMKLVCKSRTYQLSLRPNEWNEDDKINHSHALARRLPAETLFDAVFRVTGSTPKITGAKPGQRATQLSDGASDTRGGLLAVLGRPARESACECERSSDLRLGSVMALLSGPTIAEAINDPTNALASLVEGEKEDRKLIEKVFLRILNRPATTTEIEETLSLFPHVETDYHQITNELAALEVELAPSIAELTRQHEENIARADTNLATYHEMTKSLKAELEKRHKAETTLSTRLLKEYEKLLPAQAAFLEARLNPAETKTVWAPVEVKKVSAGGRAKLKTRPDGSIVSYDRNTVADFDVVAESRLTNITGVLLEVLPDEPLPRFGPGWGPDGNFVLSEIELRWGVGKAEPDIPVTFADARADFSQENMPVSSAIDGKTEADQSGWGIGGSPPGILRHTAAFKLEKPIANSDTNGTALRFILRQTYAPEFQIGRFRLYVTSSDEPLDFGLPEPVVDALKASAGQRTPEQTTALVEYYRHTDVEFWLRKLAAADAAKPLPADPKLKELEKAVADAKLPIRLNPHLVQLRQDAKASGQQIENPRLTVVQDLAWALINSPGFLFNY